MPRAEIVRLLFVAGPPPASGGFFYHRDSGLYRAMRDAFTAVDRTIGDENFLKRFQAAGCYLVDLCGRPVDDLEPASRRAPPGMDLSSIYPVFAEKLAPGIQKLLRSAGSDERRF